MGKMTQEDRLLRYMQEFNSVTSLDALRDLGIIQLPARIFKLKRKGYIINDKWVTINNRYGEPIEIKQYYLGGQIEK